MRTKRISAAIALAAASALTLSGCSMGAPSGGSQQDASAGGKLTVWIMQGDQSEDTIKAINERFTKETGVKVDVQTQVWADINTKVTTALSTDTPPDVIDLGNTQVAGFAVSGGLLDLTDKADDMRQGHTWLSGLEEPATIDGRLYGIPALGAAGAVIYNKKMWSAAGIDNPPSTYEELETDLQKLRDANTDKDFSPFYMPGRDWKSAARWIWDAGGDFAEQQSDGTWKSTLSSDKSLKGIDQWLEFQHKWSSEASRSLDTGNPDFSQLLAEGKTGAILNNSAGIRTIQQYNPDLTTDDLGSFPMPGASGKLQPAMMAGSVWGVAQKSKRQELALKWIKIAASPEIQKDYVFAKDGWMPNYVEGLDEVMKSADFPSYLTGFFESAKDTKATPASPQWLTIENDSSLNCFGDIATGATTAKAAAKSFDEHADSLYAKK
ncbi:sugar ABC transporter substrate-binding protein [Bifidobacterium aerophilum]|uniref:sugar ABC transporter substrate-binding protein n=1 Tax=Bifidobacterium aerophilum TaxID=1798155 RepID=UPI00195346C1|nr:sugar ABC transporter substrate-binding protein [Bifidobacterium aerophilum]